MKSLTLLVAASAVTFRVAAAGVGAQTAGGAIPPGDAVRGKAVYAAHQCWACHGYNGETGTRLLQEDGTFTVRMLTPSGFVSFLRAPRPNDPPPTGSSLNMPSYGAVSLPNQQAADLFAYIKTFKPTQPALQDVPLLNQMIKEGGKLQK